MHAPELIRNLLIAEPVDGDDPRLPDYLRSRVFLDVPPDPAMAHIRIDQLANTYIRADRRASRAIVQIIAYAGTGHLDLDPETLVADIAEVCADILIGHPVNRTPAGGYGLVVTEAPNPAPDDSRGKDRIIYGSAIGAVVTMRHKTRRTLPTL